MDPLPRGDAVARVLVRLVVLCVVLVVCAARGAPVRGTTATSEQPASWLWCDAAGLRGLHVTGGSTSNPTNTFVYFRTTFSSPQPALDGSLSPVLRVAADSNAAVFVNGHAVRLKVTRFNESDVRAEVVSSARLAPLLNPPGHLNSIVVQLFSWGPITQFQRTGAAHAGVWLSSNVGVSTSPSSAAHWACTLAPQYLQHNQQIVGIGGAHRIRFPQVINGSQRLPGDIHSPSYDTSSWGSAVVVNSGPWPATPLDVETPGATIGPLVAPHSVVAAGSLSHLPALDLADAWNMANRVANATYSRDAALTQAIAANLTAGKPFTLAGEGGSSSYVTVDFARPVHGYPHVVLQGAPAGTVVDFGYTEKAIDLYTGDAFVLPSGWLNPIGIVGHGLGDRYIASGGTREIVQLPDERTARWMVLQVTFPPSAGRAASVAMTPTINQISFPVEPQIGSFSCGDATIDNGIVPLALEHIKVAMSDVLCDTPGREDGQWIEDARPRANIASRWYGNRGLRQVLVREQAEAQRSNGAMHPFAPSNYPAWPAAYDWAVQWVAAMYDDYLWRGETDLIRRYWLQLVRFWDNCLAHVNAQGLWLTSQVLADIRVGVHCSGDACTSGIVTPWIIQRLRWSVHMATSVGNVTVAAGWNATAQRMTAAFREQVVVPAAQGIPTHVPDVFNLGSPDGHQGYSQAGQTIAVFAGLLDGMNPQANLNYSFPPPVGSPPDGVVRWNNPTYGYRAWRALSYAGLPERAVAHLKERYSQYLPGTAANPVPRQFQGPWGGPLPEYWISRVDRGLKPGQVDTAQPVDGSGSHGWCGVALLWLHDSVLGVNIASPGGARMSVAPQRSGLPYVCGTTSMPKGTVSVCWHKVPGVLSLSTPMATTTTVVNPPSCADGSALRMLGHATGCHLSLASGNVSTAVPTAGGGYILSQGGVYMFKCVCGHAH